MIDREVHQKWFEGVVSQFKTLSPEIREIELSHLETALREIPPKKKPGPKKGFKKGKVKGTKLPKPQETEVDPLEEAFGPPEEQ